MAQNNKQNEALPLEDRLIIQMQKIQVQINLLTKIQSKYDYPEEISQKDYKEFCSLFPELLICQYSKLDKQQKKTYQQFVERLQDDDLVKFIQGRLDNKLTLQYFETYAIDQADLWHRFTGAEILKYPGTFKDYQAEYSGDD